MLPSATADVTSWFLMFLGNYPCNSIFYLLNRYSYSKMFIFTFQIFGNQHSYRQSGLLGWRLSWVAHAHWVTCPCASVIPLNIAREWLRRPGRFTTGRFLNGFMRGEHATEILIMARKSRELSSRIRMPSPMPGPNWHDGITKLAER